MEALWLRSKGGDIKERRTSLATTRQARLPGTVESEVLLKVVRFWLARALNHVFLLAGGLVVILPFLWMVTTSLKPVKLAYAPPHLIPLTLNGRITWWRGKRRLSPASI